MVFLGSSLIPALKGRSTTNGEQSPRYHGDLEIKQEGIKDKKK